jgi:Ala-tRNA(Pro) deacylase
MAEETLECNSKIGAFWILLETARAGRYRDASPFKPICGYPMPVTNAPKTPEDLFAFLDGLGIAVKTVTHPPLHTVADSQNLRGEIAGGHTKNLFVKDKKDTYFLLTVDEDAVVDLKSIHHVIGAASKVSFGRPEALLELLGVVPGAVTAFGPINDGEAKVKVFLDAGLMSHAIVNCHPLVNTATTSIASADLVKFLKATGHDPVILKLTAESPN